MTPDAGATAAAPVTIARDTVAAIVAHARREAPRECCGLLVGEGRTVAEAVATENVAAEQTRYQVDPRAHIALLRRLRGSPRTIVGAYHSHPAGPARPSASDVREAYDDTFFYLIVSLADADPQVAAFVVRGAQAQTLRLELHG